jgi:hypothetical protein
MRVIVVLIALCSIAAGVFLVRAPARVIDLQKRFYASINWRMEPIDVPRELRNTAAMGVFLIACVVAATSYALLRGFLR